MKKSDYDLLIKSFAEMAVARGAVSQDVFDICLEASDKCGEAAVKMPAAFDKYKKSTSNKLKLTKPILQKNRLVTEAKTENHSISPKISEFIEKNIELIDNNDWKMLAVQGVAYNLLPVNWLELFNIMKKVLSVSDDKIMEAKWAAFDMMFLGEIIHLGNQAKNDPFERKANAWSRLDYVLEGMGYPFDLEHKDIVNHLLKPEIQKSLNIKMRPLSADYGWYGEGDYDLGWFNEMYFDKYMRDGN